MKCKSKEFVLISCPKTIIVDFHHHTTVAQRLDIRYTVNALRQIPYLPMYKLTFHSLKISPKITRDLYSMGQKLRSIINTALFCILTMRCLKIEVSMLQKQE